MLYGGFVFINVYEREKNTDFNRIDYYVCNNCRCIFVLTV